MNLQALTRPLSIEEIDFRVQSVNNGGFATILAYKDARADMTRLDEAVGPLGWKREHTNGNSNCVVSLYNEEEGQWVSKEDTGSESFTEKEKGLASDSFKRACFNWGIGRELYDYPLISVKLNADEITEKNGKKTASWKLRLKDWIWFSQFDEDGKLSFLACKDQNNKKRFAWGEYREDLVEQATKVKPSNPSPSEETPVRGTTDQEEGGNIEGLTKKAAEPVDSPSEIPKEMSEEDIKRAELEQKYLIIFGTKPRANMKTETIEKKIAEETMRKQSAQEESKGSEVYSAPGEPAEEETEMEAEEVEAEEVDTEHDALSMFTDAISGYKDRTEFVAWAKSVVQELTGTVTDEELKGFQTACNEHYAKIG